MEHSERALIGRGSRSDGTRSVPTTINVLTALSMVDLRINETLQTGAVENRTYRGAKVSI